MEHTLTPATDAELRDRLRATGLRSTTPRAAVLRLLNGGSHWSATDVFEAVRVELPGTSVQAIYGILNALTEVRLVRKIETSGGAALFEMHEGDNHHHIVCVECGELRDVPCAIGEAPCLTASDDHGYEIVAADVTYRGICPSCRANAAA
ncbi:Fur family ferric uptake transcriptional regulator [Leucobacter exalbidus]|uniref:Fur family ferric uptake transcriptional regulator n=1 Tax=Leucobacter exalbidus TaxID=662960 RepID=A0A940T613_9MICO|nr:Fur family transcriptional regulator [Leucobacter exalbidus]MBP1326521.1 Fur family ferric uptake transcriptional regulator [Leucobacter exalbidus]